MNMKQNSVSRIRWIIKKFKLDTQTIRARLVNNPEAPMQEFFSATEHITKSVQ